MDDFCPCTFGKYVTVAGQCCLTRACKHGDAASVRLLLADARIQRVNDESIQYACRYGHADCLRLLLADGRAKPTKAACNWAVHYGRVGVLQLLWTDPRVDVGHSLRGVDCLRKQRTRPLRLPTSRWHAIM